MCADQIRRVLAELESQPLSRLPKVSAAVARRERPPGGAGFLGLDLKSVPQSHRGVTAALRLLTHGHLASREMCNAGEGADGVTANCRAFFLPTSATRPTQDERAMGARSLKVCEERNDQITPLLRGLPGEVLDRLGLGVDPPSDWMEALLRLGHHFRPPGLAVERLRTIPPRDGKVVPELVPEGSLAREPVERRAEVIPGVTVYRLAEGVDFLTATVAGLRLLLKAVEGVNRGMAPAPHGEFSYLHTAFTALRGCPAPILRWFSLTELWWVENHALWQSDLLLMPGVVGPSDLVVTARRNSDIMFGGMWGDGTGTWKSLAAAAGALLPEWPAEPHSAVLAAPDTLARWVGGAGPSGDRPPEASSTWADNAGWVTDLRGPTERWVGWVLETLTRHRPQHVRVRPHRGGDPSWFAGMADLEGIDPFTASALAIELSGLLPTPVAGLSQPPRVAGENASGGTAGTSRPGRPRRTAPSPTRLKPRQADVLRILDAAKGRRLKVRQICDRWTQGETPGAKSITRAVKSLCDQNPPLATRGDKPRSGAMITEAGRRALGGSRRPETG